MGNRTLPGGGGAGGIAGIPTVNGVGNTPGTDGVDGTLVQAILVKVAVEELVALVSMAPGELPVLQGRAGGRGSYNPSDLTVYGPGELPSEDPRSGADDIVPGSASGANASPLNGLPYVYGQSNVVWCCNHSSYRSIVWLIYHFYRERVIQEYRKIFK